MPFDAIVIGTGFGGTVATAARSATRRKKHSPDSSKNWAWPSPSPTSGSRWSFLFSNTKKTPRLIKPQATAQTRTRIANDRAAAYWAACLRRDTR